MVLDPTTGGGIGGWGLAPIGTPSQSTAPLPLRAQPQLTPEQIAMLRQNAMALQEPPKQNIQSWTQGVAELVRAIQGNREADFARQQEAANRQANSDAYLKLLPPTQSGNTPATTTDSGSPGPAVADASPSGTPTASGAAPAGTPGSAPAGATNTTTADASDPRGIRNNNPLNIEDGDFARSQPGYAGGDGRFAKFATPDHGLAAANTLIDTYQTKHGLNTIAGIVSRWAPSSDGNNTQAYAADVAARIGIGPNDPIPAGMRDKLIAAMAQHENGRPLTTAAAAPPAAPTGLLAPIQPVTPPSATSAPLSYAPAGPAADLPPEITQGASPPRAAQALPAPDISQASVSTAMGRTPTDFGAYGSPKFADSPISPSALAPMVDAIAGRSAPAIPPADFASQAAIMANRGAPVAQNVPAQTLSPPEFARQAAIMANGGGAPAASPTAAPSGSAVPPDVFARQAAALIPPPATTPPTVTQAQPIPPDVFARQVAAIAGGAPPAAANPAAVPPAPVPVPQPRPAAADAPSFLPTGSAVPGAVGPTSVNGAPLVPPGTVPGASAALPPAVGPTSTNGQPLIQPRQPAPSVAPMVSAIAGRQMPPASAPVPAAGVQVAQNGMPTSAAPAPSGGPSPLMAPHPSMEQFRAIISDPRTSPELKALAVQQAQQLMQPQTLKVPGGTVQFIPGTGQHQFIPEEVPVKIKSGSQEVDGRAVYDPATGKYHVQTLLPDENSGGKPGEPNLSTIGGMQASEAAQAGAKAASEQRGKALSAIHIAIGGDAFNAARQEPILDAMVRIAPAAITGAGSDTALALNRIASQLGINPQGAAPREVFNQLSAKLLGDQFANLRNMAAEEGSPGGKIFKSMLELEEKANITPEDSLAGVQAKLAFMQHAGQMLQRWGNLADDYAAAHNGQIDEGFMKALRKDMASQKFDDVLPDVDNKSPTGMKTAPPAIPSGAADYLKANPQLRDQFEAKYGPGSAASVLGAAPPVSQ